MMDETGTAGCFKQFALELYGSEGVAAACPYLQNRHMLDINVVAPMLDACLETKTNYIDVTGEIEVFQAVWSRKREIEQAGITAIPGAGFDVIPTDNLAGYVASRLEQPSSLLIALCGLQSVSQGTLRTAIRQISKPVLCRRAGTIVVLEDRSPHWIDFGLGAEPCVPVSWGDVATAFHSTSIGNITVYFRRTTLFQLSDVLGKAVRAGAS